MLQEEEGQHTPNNPITMGKKKSSATKAQAEAPSPRKTFYDSLGSWNDARTKSGPLAKMIVDLRNETTYATSEKLENVMGVLMRPSKLYIDVTEKLQGALAQLEVQHTLMATCTETMVSVLSEEAEWSARRASEKEQQTTTEGTTKEGESSYDTISAYIDTCFLENLVHEILQQTLLEKSLFESLKCNSETWSLDLGIESETAVTLLACYSYCPHLNENSLKLALETLKH